MLTTLKQKVKAYRWLSRLVEPVYREYLIRMSAWPIKGVVPDFPDDRHLQIAKLESFDEYAQWSREHSLELARQEAVEESFFPATVSSFSIPGFCALCGRNTTFESTFDYAIKDSRGRLIPNLREGLACAHCGLKNRIRASLQLFVQELEPGVNQPIYITEQFGPTFRWLSGHYSSVSGSEYLPTQGPFGKSVRGIRNEDLGRLSWTDGQFDFILSFDVLEHVVDARVCLREIFRCLRPGGRLLFTAPTDLRLRETKVRALVGPNGKVIHLMEPEYHGGNATDASNGTLCFRYFGWDVLRQLEDVGFSEAQMWLYWSRELGYLGGTQIAIAAHR